MYYEKVNWEKENISEFLEDINEKKKCNIAIITSVFSKFEGASRVAEHQAKELSKKGYSITIFTFASDIDPKNFEIKIIKPLIPIFPTNKIFRGLFILDIITTIKFACLLKEFDIIILHSISLANLAYISKKIYGNRLVFINHHIIRKNVKNFKCFSDNLYDKIFSPFQWRLIGKFDYIISVSKDSREKLLDILGIDSIVIYNKIDSLKFNKNILDKKIIRNRYNVGDNPLMLFVGRIVPSKNVHLLIDSFMKIRQNIPNANLIIVGKHYDKVYSEKLIKMSDSSIFFAKNISDEELPFFYAACDVYVTCSTTEGFNLPLVEAQACGKSVIAFDIGPHREIVKNGSLVKYGDIQTFSEKIIEIIKKNN